jgi:hypothetical protein
MNNTYETPSLEVLEICSESVLCASGQFEPWEKDEIDWDK